MSGQVALLLRALSALALYAFLAWALYALWQDVKREGRALANRRVPGVCLTVQSAGKPPEQRYFFQPEITLGRAPGCDLLLDDDAVSTRHARLSYHHNQWWLEDLSSTNGTMLNRTMVVMPTVVASGDEIECGAARIDVTLSPDAVVPPTKKMERAS